MKNILYYFLFIAIVFSACKEGDDYMANGTETNYSTGSEDILEKPILPGASQVAMYYPKIKEKKIGLVVNQTSRVGDMHLVDSLLELGVSISSIFAPEHGFRGKADAGEHIESGLDQQTGIQIVSIYGKNKKPSEEQLRNVDVMIFDIQDVGARFYTYISTLHYVMEACAEAGVPLIVLDRPNPNGFYVDGPILDPKFQSFVGMHKVPVVHGMTIGEYAKMINGEKWLKDGMQCDLEVIPCVNYLHNMTYELPVKPSPNLPNLRSIMLYPSICFFEGTKVSIGRGTDMQFQVIGHPLLKDYDFQFTPEPRPGATNPKLNGQKCYGIDLTQFSTDFLKGNARLDLRWLIEVYNAYPNKEDFFINSSFFDKLAGGTQLREQLTSGLSEEEIRASWKPGLERYKEMRSQYLMYKKG